VKAGEVAERELPSGLVTFCFVDVAGSAWAFWSDPAGYPAALTAHHELVRAALGQSGGIIVETEGDGAEGRSLT
jgi:class 3 adenylate cyclase